MPYIFGTTLSYAHTIVFCNATNQTWMKKLPAVKASDEHYKYQHPTVKIAATVSKQIAYNTTPGKNSTFFVCRINEGRVG